ncbi:MAG TPA: RNA polymerase sigma factor region1.1 domain-containing protein, partial [Burkholderiales bacterium]|nr:RNA polymerase sigma factor region1.1 domain-containing protein [Burkholderiales bacterium]
MKPAAAEKAVAAAASLREKERAKAAAALAARKAPATGRAQSAHAAHGKANDSARPADARGAAAKPGDKRPLGLERRVPVMPEDRQSQLKLLIARGKEQGYLTYAQVNDHLPSEIVDPEQIEDIVNTINDMGIPVYEKAPDTESLLATEPSAPADEEAIEEAAAALAALDAELGRTTDPVRMYMREMGTVELLTREGEIRIAKRIEEGLDAVRSALAMYPATYDFLLRAYEPVKAGQARLVDVIVGFIDPNAPDVIAQPQNPTKMELVTAEEKAEEEEESEEDGDSEEEAVDTGPDPL